MSRLSRHPHWRTAALAAGALLIMGLWTGCSERKHYKLLSFFFDGVPNPYASLAGGGIEQADGKPIQLITHQPFREGKCQPCHESQGVFFEQRTTDSSVCFTCHEKVLTQYQHIHGPVAAKACLWCHAPHESIVPGLLRLSAPGVCIQCHDYLELSSKVPEHQDQKANCLTCHVGHGSSERKLLRADRPASSQPAVPATSPAAVAGGGHS